MRVARAALVLVAVVITAWFLLGARQAHDLAAATNLVTSGPLTATQAARARSLLDAAGTLNPDSNVKLARSLLASDRGDHRQALAVALAVARQEPRNILAWYEVAQVSDNSPYLGVALHKIRVLSPVVPAPH